MPLWKLEPIDLTDRNWDTSTYKGDVIVRAKDLEKAKHLAGKAFGIATSHRAGEKIKINPWIHPSFVETSQVQATDDYAEDGDQEIVYPPKAVASAHHGYNRE